MGVSSNGFTYDTQYATSVVTVPVNNNYYNLSTQSLPVISGTAVDETFGNRGASVNYSIKESTTSLYWDSNTSTFNSVAEKFLPMTFGAPNVWSSTHPALLDGRSYQTRMQSTDLAGNLEPLRTATTFTFDISSPTTRVVLPAPTGYYSSLPLISGTVGDNTNLSGVNKVDVAISVDTGTWYSAGSQTFDQGGDVHHGDEHERVRDVVLDGNSRG